MIYAGSWQSRMDRTLTNQEIRAKVTEIKNKENDSLQYKIKNSDPSTSKEYLETLTERYQDLDEIEKALVEKLQGEALEHATQLIEDANARLWLELKAILAMHAIEPALIPTHHLTAPLYHAIEALRPVRDYIYKNRFTVKDH
jgi:hypothetical protein